MATRADIRDAFYSELLAAAATDHTVTYGDGSTTTVTITDGDVKLQDPAGLEELPGVVYSENYTLYPYNEVGTGPHTRSTTTTVTSPPRSGESTSKRTSLSTCGRAASP